MSNGLNNKFMRDPPSFMRLRPLDIPYDAAELNGATNEQQNFPNLWPAGVYEFDLEAGARGAYHLRAFVSRTKAATENSNRIRAYWLPWNGAGASTITLGAEADFFFTSALGGCRIQIGAGANPEVMHISGQLTQPARQALAETIGNYQTSRRFSSTTEYPRTGLAFLVGKAQSGWFSTRRWRFYAQGIAVDPATGIMSVADMTDHHNGVVTV